MNKVSIALLKTANANVQLVIVTDGEGTRHTVHETDTSAKAREFADKLIAKNPDKFACDYPPPGERGGKVSESVESALDNVADLF